MPDEIEISWDSLREAPERGEAPIQVAPATSDVPEVLRRVTHVLKACMALCDVPFERRVVTVSVHEALDEKSWEVKLTAESLGILLTVEEPTFEEAVLKMVTAVRDDLNQAAARHDRQAAEAQATMRKHKSDADDLRVLVAALGTYEPGLD